MNCKYASTCTRRYAPTCILLYLAKWYWRMQVGAYLPCWCVFAGRLVRICHVGAYSLCWCVISKVGLYILNVASYILNVEYLVIWRSIHLKKNHMINICSFAHFLMSSFWEEIAQIRSKDRNCCWRKVSFILWKLAQNPYNSYLFCKMMSLNLCMLTMQSNCSEHRPKYLTLHLSRSLPTRSWTYLINVQIIYKR